MAAKEEIMKFYLFNCDETYDLKTVEKLLLDVEENYSLKISAEPLYFGLQRMDEFVDTTLPTLKMDFAIFVLHADESRLSINEDNAGIGYAKFYRALLRATDGKVLIVIGGDTYYKDEEEEENFVMSRWVRRKISPQFREEDMDGRKSFILSWNKKHRPIHEEALRHFLNPGKKGCTFHYTPPPKLVPSHTEPDSFPPLEASHTDREPLLMEQEQDKLEETTHSSLVDRGGDKPEPYRRSFGDRYEQECDYRRFTENDADTSTSSAASGKLADYPAGKVLLETRLHYGTISYQAEDIIQWTDRWLPPDRHVAHLKQEFGSTPEAKVQFTAIGNGGVSYDVTIMGPRTRNWCLWLCNCLGCRFRSLIRFLFSPCPRLRNQTLACFLCVAHCFGFVCWWIIGKMGRLGV
ncbi:uncharacterized protein [Montipora foliosa]|uniref:uncharacterized protein n=1 Tax=Montipora foliosa TaxID=591990 RepID=UPI0035F0FB81